MAQSKITLIGMENYLNPEKSVFDNMVLPDGIDKNILVGTILMRCQEFELLYSDPDFMTTAVNIWSRKHYWTFDKWAKLLTKEYEPLYNKDYFEKWSDIHEGKYSKEGSSDASGKNIQTNDLTQENDLTQTNDLTQENDLAEERNLASTNDVTLTHSEKAFNDSSFVETTQDVTDQDGSETGTVSNTGTVTNTGTVSNTGTVTNSGTVTDEFGNKNSSDESGDDQYENVHDYHGYGNIGVMSSQELFMKEVNVAKWNMYEHIADIFCSEFCIMIY